jgi:Reverse transcriptase (RNA-dependent DNA polymerase)
LQTTTTNAPIHTADKIADENQQLETAYNITVNSDPGDPRTIRKALQGDNADAWRKGLYKEYDNFTNHKAWTPEILPEERKLLQSKSICKTKQHAVTGETIHKVRNVILGYMQIPGIDYTDSYAATAMDQSIMTVLALGLYEVERRSNDAGDDAWIMAQTFDVKAAFLNSALDEPVYINFPKHYQEYCQD